MARVVSVFLPNWPTDRFRRKLAAAAPPAETPLVLIGREGRRRVVVAADPAAQAAGLRIGTPVTKAQALTPGLIVRDANPADDRQALERLALWALRRYAPIAAADPPDGIVIDVTGAVHLHGGEDALVKDLVRRIVGSGFAARAALADSWGSAHALARFAARPVLVVPAGESAKAICDLPVRALRLPNSLVDTLGVLGFQSIGELAATPRAPLALRFGPELGRRLDQALGRLAEPIIPVRPPDLMAVRRAFAEPIGAAETIARYTGLLVVALCDALAAKELGARRLDLVFHRVDTSLKAIRIGTAAPVRDAKRLTRMFCDKIETIDPGFGVEMMSLAATITEPLAARQLMSSLAEDPDTERTRRLSTMSLGRRRAWTGRSKIALALSPAGATSAGRAAKRASAYAEPQLSARAARAANPEAAIRSTSPLTRASSPP